jgi:hypothetical protein
MPRLNSTPFTSALSCLCLLAGFGSVAQAQLSISLDDGGVQIQNGTTPPLVVGPGQSFGGTLTPQGFQGVMTGPKGTTRVTPKPTMTNPFRDAAEALIAQPMRIKAGDVSLTLPLATAPTPAARAAMPRAKLMAVRELLQKADYAAAKKQLDRLQRDYAVDAEFCQMKALAMLQMHDEREAAACVYDALAMAPCWDWTALRMALPDKTAATQMYRRLQQTAREKPALHRHFLLAWWERMLDHRPESLAALQAALELHHDPLFLRLQREWTATPEDDAPPAVQP